MEGSQGWAEKDQSCRFERSFCTGTAGCLQRGDCRQHFDGAQIRIKGEAIQGNQRSTHLNQGRHRREGLQFITPERGESCETALLHVALG